MPNQEETRSTIETKKAELSKLLKRKRILKQNRENQKKARERKIIQVLQREPSKQTPSTTRTTLGRPKRFDGDDALVQIIKDMAIAGSAADPRRRR